MRREIAAATIHRAAMDLVRVIDLKPTDLVAGKDVVEGDAIRGMLRIRRRDLAMNGERAHLTIRPPVQIDGRSQVPA